VEKTYKQTLSPVAYLLLLSIAACPAITGCVGMPENKNAPAQNQSLSKKSRTIGTFVEDTAIELKGLKALRGDAEIKKNTHIGVTSYNQVVLLTGQAPTEELRERVLKLILGVPKVRQIHNEIVISAPNSLISRSNDSVLTAKVKSKLFASELSGMKIKVISEAGTVYLMGLVPTGIGDEATQIARSTGGVQKVVRLFEHSKQP